MDLYDLVLFIVSTFPHENTLYFSKDEFAKTLHKVLSQEKEFVSREKINISYDEESDEISDFEKEVIGILYVLQSKSLLKSEISAGECHIVSSNIQKESSVTNDKLEELQKISANIKKIIFHE